MPAKSKMVVVEDYEDGEGFFYVTMPAHVAKAYVDAPLQSMGARVMEGRAPRTAKPFVVPEKYFEPLLANNDASELAVCHIYGELPATAWIKD